MSPMVVILVLAAAVLHASWNALVKSSGQPIFAIGGFRLVGALVCLTIVPWVPLPSAASWPFVIASVIIHTIYYLTLSKSYQLGDLSQVYPIFRGLAPILVTLMAGLFAGEWLPLYTTFGIGIVSVGIMSLAFTTRIAGRLSRTALKWGLATSVLIALYTVTDGLGVRLSENPLSYILWIFLLEPLPIGLWLILTLRQEWFDYLRTNKRTVIAGGLGSTTAYGLVIFAMSLGAMAVVSSLRETSVIFAAVIGSVILKEPFGRSRITAAVLIAIGILVIKFE